MKGYPFPDTEVAVYWAREGVLPIFSIAPGRYCIIANIPPSGEEHPRDPTLEEIVAIVNTGDDFVHLGLTVCPDIDTLLYTLSGKANAAHCNSR